MEGLVRFCSRQLIPSISGQLYLLLLNNLRCFHNSSSGLISTLEFWCCAKFGSWRHIPISCDRAYRRRRGEVRWFLIQFFFFWVFFYFWTRPNMSKFFIYCAAFTGRLVCIWQLVAYLFPTSHWPGSTDGHLETKTIRKIECVNVFLNMQLFLLFLVFFV